LISLEHTIDLVYELTKKELKVRYKNSVLGYLWSLLNPLVLSLVFYVGLGLILQAKVPAGEKYPYFLMLICGLFPWQWFSNSINAGANVYIANANLIRKVAFPREFLPLATVLNDLVHFLVSLPVITLFLVISGLRPSVAWIWGLPALVAAEFLVTYGLALIVSSLNLFFRDLANLVSLLLQMLFYLTPIVYAMDWIKQPLLQKAVLINPVTPLFACWHDLLLKGRLNGPYFALASAYGLVAFAAGLAVHHRLKGKFAEMT